MVYFCCDARRRDAVLNHPTLNGIDQLAVVDRDAPAPTDRQRLLRITLIKPLGDLVLTAANVRIEGGERIRNIQVTEVTPLSDAQLQIRVDQPGDFSPYILRLIAQPDSDQPPAGIDPILAAIQFSFKVECPSEFDCRSERICPPELTPPSDINYLARDYASFRQLMLDRMAVLIPQWQDRNPADLGTVLVELLAHVGDQLSYQLDAVATEAYLQTARRRTSIRRHARLVDYRLQEGSNARTWVQIQTNADNVEVERGTRLFTRISGADTRIAPNSPDYERAIAQQPIGFETLAPVTLFQTHNELQFYTWGAQSCCLPKGAVRATLIEHHNLQPGDVLIFEEIRGSETGAPEDANPTHRHAVRLTEVIATTDPLGGQFASPPTDAAVPVTQITWDAGDALPFAFCISAQITQDNQQTLQTIGIARGNIVLADHGITVSNRTIGTVPQSHLFRVPANNDPCASNIPQPIPPRFRPRLADGPLTYAVPYNSTTSAWATLHALESPQPVIELTSQIENRTATWQPQFDLLSSGREAEDFVVEPETDGTVYLRFGDDRFGKRPAAATSFTARYRIGNGILGNIGTASLVHIVSDDSRIVDLYQPLPATGGRESESIETVRQQAPAAFRTQARAVTPEDYAGLAEQHPQVQRAVATFRSTRSWRTVFITLDRVGGLPVDTAFAAEIRQYLERYRLAGYDLKIDAPRYVALELEMTVCVRPEYFRSQVKQALLEVLSDRVLPDGRRGLFHPDHFTFGQSVYLSQIYAAAQAMTGVATVEITTFQRQGTSSQLVLPQDKVELGRLEIAQLANNPNFPERGVVKLRMQGGK